MKFSSVAIQMKATEQYFPVMLFVMLCNVVLSFESKNEIRIYNTRKLLSSTFTWANVFHDFSTAWKA